MNISYRVCVVLIGDFSHLNNNGKFLIFTFPYVYCGDSITMASVVHMSLLLG